MKEGKLAQKAQVIFKLLLEKYPDATIELNYGNTLELLVATVLSAQCTDKRVNQVTEKLFAKYHEPVDYLNVSAEELEQDIRSTGFFRQKAKSLRNTMRTLIDKHNEKVPGKIELITALPGIGRKTANVILGNAFGIPAIAVDTHVKRISNRLGLTDNKVPDKIEQDLMHLYPDSQWIKINHLFVFHGRYTCKARSPACEKCPLTNHCNHFKYIRSKPNDK
ncbi:MAG: endonuclease III [Lentisphaeria bacterium]